MKKNFFDPKSASVILHSLKEFWWHPIFGTQQFSESESFGSIGAGGGGGGDGARSSILADGLYYQALRHTYMLSFYGCNQ